MFATLLSAALAAMLTIFPPQPGHIGIFFEREIPADPNLSLLTSSTETAPPSCDPAKSLAGRQLPIEAKEGQRFGTVQFPGTLPLHDKEVVLTFDDGPHPTRTRPILDILDRYCVKAVFFSIGEMALEHPDVLRDVAARGHLIGTHTFSHPFNMARLGKERAEAEIDAGFAAVSHVLGGPVAPLFRFPGLAQSRALLDDLSQRRISVWSVDVITEDSFVSGPYMTARLFSQLEKDGRGIVLMHDIKKATAESLEGILQTLKDKGYSVPQVTMAADFMPDAHLLEAFAEGKSPRSHGLFHRASGRSGNAPAASRRSARFQPARRDEPEFPWQ
jgi:peptidoglycan/xylan/chitin deacetylase (PgdA/CDA1 family)